MKSRGAAIIATFPAARAGMHKVRHGAISRHRFRAALCCALIFAAVACAALTTPSAAALRAALRIGRPNSTAARSGDANSADKKGVRSARAEKGRKAVAATTGLFPSLMPALPPVGETVTTFASDCTTAQTVFNLGDTVCAKIENAATFSLFALRRSTWVNTSGFIFQPEDVTNSNDTVMFTLPTTAVSPEGIDRRGGWSVNLISTSDGSVHATAAFTVRDPANAAANLSVFQLAEGGEATVGAGGNITYTVTLSNRGPDDAQNVQLTEGDPTLSPPTAPAPAFVSKAQLSGPACTFSDNSNCTIASLPVGSVATFAFTYNVPTGTPNYTVVADTASVTSSTTDPRPSDNTSLAETTVDGTATATE